MFFPSATGQKLYKAVEQHDYTTVKSLLEKGEKVGKYTKNLFPLWRAAADNDTAIALLLLEHGADVHQKTKGEAPVTSLRTISTVLGGEKPSS